MSLTTTIPGADFSASGLPQFERRIAGFPALGLKGLYLFEDGAVGTAVSAAMDSSGLGQHAPLAAGAMAGVKDAGGLASTSSLNPAVFRAPGLGLGQEFSAVLVGKSDMTAEASGGYPWWWRPSSDVATGVDTNQVAAPNREAINLDAATAIATCAVGWSHGSGYMDGATSTFSRRALISASGPRFTSWFAVAFAFSPAANRFRMVFAGQSFEVVHPTPGAASAAKVGNHLFGVGRWGVTTNSHPGKMGLFALYQAEKSMADLTALITAAKARMALRGISAT